MLAGGAGSRMGPLTEHRAKPALPFAGHFRLIDFPLSNCANSGVSDVWVLQQYRPHSIEDHLANGRPWDLDRTEGGLLILHPFTGGEGEGFTEGNADALWRHRRLIGEFGADVVLVLSADAVYTLDYREVVAAHLERDADVTMVTTRVDEDAGRFGVVSVDVEHRVTGFAYKPDDPESDVVTTEVFAYRSSALLETLEDLGDGEESLDDFGDALLPRLVEKGRAFDFPLPGYWRDVGTPQSYWQAHQDLVDGRLDLDDLGWPIRTTSGHRPPARVEAGGSVEDSLLSPACRVAGQVRRSILSPGAVVEAGAVVEESVILHGVVVRAGARVEKAIVDSKVEIGGDAHVRSTDPDEPIVVHGRD
ncbi:MAG TPA: sugar phosphate nucleotidyltransferase [Acidimicrobiales bacterium]|nr:sugar phosphate nucleotidyltransferase [Acidimicrobiales bacterium]